MSSARSSGKMDLTMNMKLLAVIMVAIVTSSCANGQLLLKGAPAASALVSDIHISCHSHNILVNISTNPHFNGMVYPRGLFKNSSCMTEYHDAGPTVTYTLPLRSCNTMSTDFDEGIEYFNTIVVQPHRKLVTSLGKGYQVRCKYQTKEQTITSNFNVSQIGTTPVTATAPMPTCSMKIFSGNVEDNNVAESVKIGDRLSLVISIDFQDVYGLKVTNCLVRDGLGWGEQPLINNEGCPVDEDIMGPFEYVNNKTEARVAFQAHKFPYTESVYYQCNVKFCLKHGGGCEDVPPACDISGHNLQLHRRRRSAGIDNTLEEEGNLLALLEEDMYLPDRIIEVYSGLYVRDEEQQQQQSVRETPEETKTAPLINTDEFCVSTRKFAFGIVIACVILLSAVAMLVYCVLHKRRRRKGASSAYSIYARAGSVNTAYTME